jgi:hypothetical protein
LAWSTNGTAQIGFTYASGFPIDNFLNADEATFAKSNTAYPNNTYWVAYWKPGAKAAWLAANGLPPDTVITSFTIKVKGQSTGHAASATSNPRYWCFYYPTFSAVGGYAGPLNANAAQPWNTLKTNRQQYQLMTSDELTELSYTPTAANMAADIADLFANGVGFRVSAYTAAAAATASPSGSLQWHTNSLEISYSYNN